MPVSVQHSPPPIHHPGDVTKRPKGILKNPSFSAASSNEPTQTSPASDGSPTFIRLDPIVDAKELTLQNTLQNAGAGHRRSSSAARRQSLAHRQSAAGVGSGEGLPDEIETDPEMRLKWDEANLFLAEQDKGTRMKITEPKTPYEYGREIPPDEDDDLEDVSIDPKYVAVDEVEMAKQRASGGGTPKKQHHHRESDIPGLELGEPEEDVTLKGENDRIVRGTPLSREGSQSSSSTREKHVSVSESDAAIFPDQFDHDTIAQVGMPTPDEMEKHREFEERRKKHYEMKDIRGLLGHPEDIDEIDEDDEMEEDEPGQSSQRQELQHPPGPNVSSLPSRGVNGAR